MSVGKLITIILLTVLLIWLCFTAYMAYGISENVEKLNSEGDLGGFIVLLQPFIWLFILLTLGLIIEVAKRKTFLVLNSILIVSIIFVGLMFLSIAVVVTGYAPIFKLDN